MLEASLKAMFDAMKNKLQKVTEFLFILILFICSSNP